MPDIVSGYTFVDGEKGVTAGKLNSQISGAVIDPSFVTSKPSSSTLDPTDQLLEVKGAGTYARITGSQLISSVSAQVDATPQIYSVRLRSFNAVGNPNFSINQRQCGAAINPTGGGLFPCDRWLWSQSGTGRIQAQQLPGFITVPGTNFGISDSYLRITVTTQESALGATDQFSLVQAIEGPQMRELSGDVHSVSLLVRSSVASLKFGLSLQDAPSTKVLAKLCTTSATPNTWSLITLPNIPVWPSGNFTTAPGAIGYYLNIVLAGGSSIVVAANDAWQTSGTTFAAVGQSNFLAQPVNSTIDFAFVQHEPGTQCTTLMDVPFTQNYDNCLRYFCKSFDYEIPVGTASANSALALSQVSTTEVAGPVRFPKPMAKIPTCFAYNGSTGAVNSIRLTGVNYAVSSFDTLGKGGFLGIITATMPAVVAGSYGWLHYAADTGW